MTIQDINYLKTNSKENIHKFHFEISTQNGNFILPDDIILTNIFTVHILNVYCTNFSQNNILTLSANNIKMDSIQISAAGNTSNTIGKEYEKQFHPLAKVNNVSWELENSISSNEKMFVTFIVRNYEVAREFNNVFNELNMNYDPHVIPESSGSESESESESDN